MGVPLIKYSCTINNQFLLTKLDEIEQSNSDLNFLVLETIPTELINTFLEQQIVLKEHLKLTYDENIDEYTFENLTILNEGIETLLCKRFALITTENDQLVARLDCTKLGSTVRLETLYVSPHYRGKKLGLWLVGKLMLHCKEELTDVKLFETNTDQYNDNALKILKKYNFYVKYTIDELIKNRK